MYLYVVEFIFILQNSRYIKFHDFLQLSQWPWLHLGEGVMFEYQSNFIMACQYTQ